MPMLGVHNRMHQDARSLTPVMLAVSWLRFLAGTVQRDYRLGVNVKLDSETLGERSLWLLSRLIFQTANSKSYRI